MLVDHTPAGGVDLHGPPCHVTEVEIEPTVQSADANVNNAPLGAQVHEVVAGAAQEAGEVEVACLEGGLTCCLVIPLSS